jgi:hypothetical protein
VFSANRRVNGISVVPAATCSAAGSTVRDVPADSSARMSRTRTGRPESLVTGTRPVMVPPGVTVASFVSKRI